MIHQTALVSDKAQLGKNVSIGPFTTIHDNVVLGENTIIEGYCELGVSNHLSDGENLVVGADSHIRSHSIFYEGSSFGDKLVTGHRCTVREKTKAGYNLQIGTLCDLQGHQEIGDSVRLHSNVHIGQNTVIKNYVWIFPYVVVTNDPRPPSEVRLGATIEDFSIIATMSVILPGTTVAKGCLIGAMSCVGGKLEEDTIYSGNPAESKGATSRLKFKDGQMAYPWRCHFHRGYPEDAVNAWIKEFDQAKA